jgi:hypothetical protein
MFGPVRAKPTHHSATLLGKTKPLGFATTNAGPVIRQAKVLRLLNIVVRQVDRYRMILTPDRLRPIKSAKD